MPLMKEELIQEVRQDWEKARMTNVVLFASLKHAREAGLTGDDALKYAIVNLVKQNSALMEQLGILYWKTA